MDIKAADDDNQGSKCEKWTGGSGTQWELMGWGSQWNEQGNWGLNKPPSTPVNSNPDDNNIKEPCVESGCDMSHDKSSFPQEHTDTVTH